MKTLLVFLTLTTISLSCPTKKEYFTKLKESTNKQYQLVKDLYNGKIDMSEFSSETIKGLLHDSELIGHIVNEHGEELTKEDRESLYVLNEKIRETSKMLSN